MKYIAILLLGIMLSISCKKDVILEPQLPYGDDGIIASSQYLIFGHFYGMCVGEYCVETFKLENGKLYEDTLDIYSQFNNSQYAFIELDTLNYLKVQDLAGLIPTMLVTDTIKTYGIPDAGDWGGYFVALQTDTTYYEWFIDKSRTNLPANLHEFADSLDSKIAQLQ